MRVTVTESPTSVFINEGANTLEVQTGNSVFIQNVGVQGPSGSAISIGGTVSGFTGGAVLFTDSVGALSQDLNLWFDSATAQFLVGGGTFDSIASFIGTFEVYDSSANYVFVTGTGVGGMVINPGGATNQNFKILGSSETLMFAYPYGNTITFGSTNILGGTVGIESVDTITPSLIIKQISLQTSDLQQWTDSGGGVFASVGSNGKMMCVEMEINGDLNHDGTAIGFFGKAPQNQQIGGVATAGAAYTANEQNMVQGLWNMARTYGLLT